MDIMRHKDAVDDIVKTGKCVMNSKSPKEKEILKVGDIFNMRNTLHICETEKHFGSSVRQRLRVSWRSTPPSVS